jgi:urease accessory protein
VAATVTDGTGEVLLMLLADARLPAGGHTQSAGLEPAVQAGLPIGSVPDYIAARLATVTVVEAGTAVAAHAACAATDPGAALATVDRAWRARVPSRALRDAAVQLGRGYARLVQRLFPSELASLLTDHGPFGRAVATGVAARLAGLSPARTARLVAYDDVQTVAAAALKLEPMDPLVAAGWVLAAAPAVDRLAESLSLITDPADIPAAGAPLIEAWAEAHALSPARLFRA